MCVADALLSPDSAKASHKGYRRVIWLPRLLPGLQLRDSAGLDRSSPIARHASERLAYLCLCYYAIVGRIVASPTNDCQIDSACALPAGYPYRWLTFARRGGQSKLLKSQ